MNERTWFLVLTLSLVCWVILGQPFSPLFPYLQNESTGVNNLQDFSQISVGQFMVTKFLGNANDGKAQESEGEKFSDPREGTRQISLDQDRRTGPVSTPWICSCPRLHNLGVAQMASLPGGWKKGSKGR